MVYTDGARVQSIFVAHIQRKGRVGGPPPRNWHFLPMPGTTVSIPTGQGAARHLDEIAQYRPAALGQGSDGFTHYRLHL